MQRSQQSKSGLWMVARTLTTSKSSHSQKRLGMTRGLALGILCQSAAG